MHDSEKAIAVARHHAGQVRVKNWPGASHSLPMKFPREIDAEALRHGWALEPQYFFAEILIRPERRHAETAAKMKIP